MPADFGARREKPKILFIRIDRIGDLVLSTPALKALKQAFPNGELSVLASQTNYPILLNNPFVDQIIIYSRRLKFKDKIDLIKHLRKCHFDLAIDPYPDYELKTAFIAFITGAKKRIGYAAYGRELFFNLQSPQIRNNQHFVDLTLDVLKPLGIVTKDKTPEIYVTESEKEYAVNWLKNKKIGDRPIIGIHPGAHFESQRWPVARFAELVTKLNAEMKVNLIIFGSRGDREIVKRIVALSKDDVLTHISDDLRQFVALVSTCNVLICNNSGPLHIAIALKIPTISTMGPTDKIRWMPFGEIHQVLRVDELSCIGCNSGYCKIKTFDCMWLITPSMVMEALKSML